MKKNAYVFLLLLSVSFFTSCVSENTHENLEVDTKKISEIKSPTEGITSNDTIDLSADEWRESNDYSVEQINAFMKDERIIWKRLDTLNESILKKYENYQDSLYTIEQEGYDQLANYFLETQSSDQKRKRLDSLLVQEENLYHTEYHRFDNFSEFDHHKPFIDNLAKLDSLILEKHNDKEMNDEIHLVFQEYENSLQELGEKHGIDKPVEAMIYYLSHYIEKDDDIDRRYQFIQ